MNSKDMENNVREQFPILQNEIIYLDSASTTQKPKAVINQLREIYSQYNANVHRGMYPLAQKADELWNSAHQTVAKYINAKFEEVFFVKNATEGLNILALIYKEIIEKGDVIVLTKAEHHSNYLPWRNIAIKKNAVIEYIKLNDDLTLDIESLNKLYEKYGNRIKIVSIVHTSNVTGITNNIKKISEIAHKYESVVIVDGTQSIVHQNIDVKELDCDFFIFSGHKIYGPNGVGVVYGNRNILEELEPVFLGGEMVDYVSTDKVEYSKLPFKFEAGTPNIADGITLATAIDWFSSIENRFELEKELSDYLYMKIKELKFVKTLVDIPSPILSFSIGGIHPHDIAGDLGETNICIRAGYHCAQPLHEKLGLKGTARVSLGIYNTKEDIDALITQLINIYERYK